MKMFQRKIMEKLSQWKNTVSKKALCIIGARQVGKSTVAREFGRKNYKKVIEINFISHPEYKRIFELPNPDSIFRNINVLLNEEIIRDETLLILDEVQECPEARTSIKFLVEDSTVDVLETGSLLGVNTKSVASMPVGFEEIVLMWPMDFEEFLWAYGIPESTLSYVKKCWQEKEEVDRPVHEKMLELFYLYMIVGGMPEVVQAYVDTYDLVRVNGIQKQILDLYRLDIVKYANRSETVKIIEIFDALPSQLDAKTKRFKLAVIDKNARLNRYENSFLWLTEAGIALPCFNLKAVELPFKLNEKRNLFKLYLCDTGLLCCSMGMHVQYELLQGNLKINQGALLENVAAQTLKTKNFPLYYFDNKKTELDFLVSNNGKIDVLEIKSGKDVQIHRSLDRALQNEEWDIERAFVFGKCNMSRAGKIHYVPIYMMGYYDEERVESLIYKPDLSALFQ